MVLSLQFIVCSSIYCVSIFVPKCLIPVREAAPARWKTTDKRWWHQHKKTEDRTTETSTSIIGTAEAGIRMGLHLRRRPLRPGLAICNRRWKLWWTAFTNTLEVKYRSIRKNGLQSYWLKTSDDLLKILKNFRLPLSLSVNIYLKNWFFLFVLGQF